MAMVPYSGGALVPYEQVGAIMYETAKPLVVYAAKKAASKLASAGWSVVKSGNQWVCDNTGICVGTKRRNKKASPSVVGRPLGTLSGGASGAFVAQNVKLRNKGPSFQQRSGVITVSHRELFATPVASGIANTFLISSFAVNPTLYTIFPWLASIAGSYEKFKFTSLEFEFIPIQPTSVAGRVGMCFDFDSQDSLPVTRSDAYSTLRSIEGNVWDRLKMSVPTDSIWRFTDYGSTVDTKQIDLGQFQFYSDQISTTSLPLGDIVVSYRVEMKEPQASIGATQKLTGVIVGGGVSSGVNLVTTTFASNTLVINFNTTGVFILALNFFGGSYSGLPGSTPAGGAVIDSSINYGAFTANTLMECYPVKVLTLPASVSCTALGLGGTTSSTMYISRTTGGVY